MFGRKEECYKDASTGIKYASHEDYEKSNQLSFRASMDKFVLERKAEKAEQQITSLTKKNNSLTKENADFKKQVASYKREVELLYLQAIGNAKSVLGVKHIQKQYHKSEAYKDTVYDILCASLQSIANGKKAGSQIDQAAATKIKRLNREVVIKKCHTLDEETNKASYAMSMMALLKLVANIEVDGTRIIEAKKAGLDAMSVFRSVLASYNVKQDEVM